MLCWNPSSSSCRSTLLVARVAVFLAAEIGPPAPGRLPRAARRSAARPRQERSISSLDLGFLDFDHATDHSHIFLENAQAALHLPAEQQRTAALLDLNYYLPCRVAAGQVRTEPLPPRTIAVIGLGRTIGGDFLSSEDVELLESLASYIGIALQNASLYARLEEKIGEFERLKEFNENIVESINVGILALDLDDRIESWNAQMEAMYALSRAEAIGQELRAVFPAEFVDAMDSFRNEQGVHHLYKFPPDHPRRRAAHRQHRHRSPALAGFRLRRPHHSGRRHHRARLAGNPTGAGRQAQLHRPAGRRRGP